MTQLEASKVAVVALATPEQLRERIKRKSRLKGRQADDASLAEVRALLGDKPAAGWRRDLLIEQLHLLNDSYGALHERHLAALAKEINVPMAEVFEVASFYHHFEVLADGDVAVSLTVRVCDGLSCELAGARDLLKRLPALLGSEVHVIAAPCLGRCEQAPVAVVHQCPVPSATVERVTAALNRCSHRAGTMPRPTCRPPSSTMTPTARVAATGWPPKSSRARATATI
jgi:formate dehydrogenase beta subunit